MTANSLTPEATAELNAVSANLSAALSQFLPDVDPGSTIEQMLTAVRREQAADTDIQFDPETAAMLNGALNEAVDFLLANNPTWSGTDITSARVEASQARADLAATINALTREPDEHDCN